MFVPFEELFQGNTPCKALQSFKESTCQKCGLLGKKEAKGVAQSGNLGRKGGGGQWE